jgi:K+-transporting ATPase ATPase C chain
MMFKELMAQMKTAFILLILLTILMGLVYPLAVTGLAQLLFPKQAYGSLIEREHQIIGSRLIGQSFVSDAYFWGRPSATSPYPYNGESSSGSNLGPSNSDFIAAVKVRVNQLIDTDPEHNTVIPVDLVTTSGSGLDPDISPLAARYQVARIATIRKLNEKDVLALIQQHIEHRTFGLLGEPRINVLELNLALDKVQQ